MAARSRVLKIDIVGDSKKFEQALGSADKRAKTSERTLDSLGKRGALSLGKLAKAASAAAVAYVGIAEAKDAVNVTTDLAKATLGLSKNLGLSVEKASEWAAVAKVRGVETKALNMAFGTLARNFEKAGQGADTQAASFERLGVTQRELKNLNFNQLLGQVADGMQRLGPGTERTAIAMQLMGRGWQTILPVLRGGRVEMEKQLKLARVYGATFSGGTIKSMEDFIAAQREARFATLGLQVAFGTQLAPTLTTVITKVARFIQQMRTGKGAGGELAKTLRDIAQVLAHSWRNIDHANDQLVHGIQNINKANRQVADAFKAVGRVATAVWNAIKNDAASNFNAIKRVSSGVIGGISDAFKALKGAVASALAPLRKAYNLLKDIAGIAGGVVGKLGDLGGAINPFGKGRPLEDFFGQFAPFAPLGAVGTLGGKGTTLAKIRQISLAMGLSGGLGPGQGYRPGDDGWHGVGRALDNSGSPANMMRFALFMAKTFGGKLLELIYTPLGFSIKNGQKTAPYAVADHYDHVHVAMRRGGKVPGQGFGDKVPALLEPGEHIIRRSVAERIRPLLEALNVQKFAGGGEVLPKSVYSAINRAMTPDFNSWAKKTYNMTGKRLLAKVAAVEGGGSIDEGTSNTSSAGARGPFQFIASTRAAYMSKYHIDAWKNDYSAARAAMIHLRGTGIAGYNPGLAAYQGMVLGAAVNTRPLRTGSVAGGGAGGRQATIVGRPPSHGPSGTYESRLAGAELAQERAAQTSGTRDDERAYLRRAKLLNQRHAAIKARLRKINTALGGKLSKANRKRLLAEKATLLQELGQVEGSLRENTETFRSNTAPPDVGDSGGDGSDPALEANTAALEEANRLKEQELALQGELKALEAQKVALLQSQGPALLAGLAMFSGDFLGRSTGRGRSFPSYTGLGGLARA